MYLELVELSGFSAQMKSIILLVMVTCRGWGMNISVVVMRCEENEVVSCAQKVGIA
jgi:hypothetical protein